MAQFIHLFDERNQSSIRKTGIKPSTWGEVHGVYAFAQTENFVVNHQWMRELRRREGLNLLAAKFRVPDSLTVFIGKYHEEHLKVTASEAIAITRQHTNPLGLEVIIPRKITVRELMNIYKPPKVTGWRYYPEAKGVKPCGCSYCQRGEPYSRSIKDADD